MNAHKFIKHKKNIRSHLSAFFLVLIIIGGLWVGCGKQGKNAQPEILIKTQISPEVNAQAVEYGDNLALSYNFPIDTKEFSLANNIFVSYGTNHTAGTPVLTSATYSWSTNKKELTIAGISGWSNLTGGAGPKVVEVVAAEGKIKDIFNNEIKAGRVLFKFTLAGIGGVSSVSPEVDATNIQPGTAISVVFSEAMDSSTITTDTFTVTSASGAVSGTVSYDGSNKTATYTPTINLGYSTEDTTALTSSIKDSNGKTLTAYSSSFTTTTQAQVSSVSPAASSTDVETNTTLQITFSKAMDESTITTDNIKLSSQYGNVSGTISYDSSNKTTTFTPGGRIANSVTFTATASAGIKDSDGNSIGSDYSWTFTSKAYSASVLYQYDGGSGDSLGYVSSAGDVNSDGKSDFIIGASKTDPGGKTNAGSAYLYSGADGSLIYQKDGENANDSYGVTSDGGKDVNADGIPDFIIGSLGINNGTGRAYVYSGADGALLFTKDGQAAKDYFGRVLILGDLNNDGYAEFGAAAPYADPGGVSAAGSAYVYSGKDGTLLYQKDGEAASDMLGNENDSLEDLNGDNVPDYIVGASGADPGGISAAGSAYVYSGADASLIYRKDGSVVNQRFGTYLSSAGDVNADGSGDFMIGDSNINTGIKGTVMLYSGKDGSLLYQKSGTEDYEFFGRALASAGDVNGDGFDDFLIGAMNPDWSGSAYIYSGKDGSLLFQKDGAIGDLLGISISSAGDVNGDGKPDFIIGAYGVDNYTGVAYVYVSE